MRRVRAIAFCLPLLILAGLFSVTVLPAMLHTGVSVDIKINSKGFDRPIVRLVVGGGKTVTDPKRIQDVLCELSSIYQSGAAVGSDSPRDIPQDTGLNIEYGEATSSSQTHTYGTFIFGLGASPSDKTIFSFIDSSDTERRFLLEDGYLIDEQTQTACNLTAVELDHLLYLIYNKTY